MTPIPGYEGRYSISRDGVVYSHLRNKPLRPFVTAEGYPRVKLYDANRVAEECLIHRLVAKTFIGNTDGLEVHHIDEDPGNPRVENLKIVTRHVHRELDKRGELHHNAKLTEGAVRMIRNAYRGILPKYIGRIFGVDARTVRDVLNGESWAHL